MVFCGRRLSWLKHQSSQYTTDTVFWTTTFELLWTTLGSQKGPRSLNPRLSHVLPSLLRHASVQLPTPLLANTQVWFRSRLRNASLRKPSLWPHHTHTHTHTHARLYWISLLRASISQYIIKLLEGGNIVLFIMPNLWWEFNKYSLTTFSFLDKSVSRASPSYSHMKSLLTLKKDSKFHRYDLFQTHFS